MTLREDMEKWTDRTGEWPAKLEMEVELELERLRRLVYEDELTGLPNMRRFREEIRRRLQDQIPFMVCYIDLDRFKLVNDRYGHETGDLLLKSAGLRIDLAAGEGAGVYRKGGDEFLLLSEDVGSAENILERLHLAFRSPFQVGDQTLMIGISAGYSVHPDNGRDEDRLLHLADLRMYSAKRQKRAAGMSFGETGRLPQQGRLGAE
ncbi:GGDEF domain-containing protein [Bhargavaea ullalensis]|uniref:Diguanylate cyclase (GGDEF)-like protein n=1 Tax=Bhargavaea ullalensis TaxID=1265685 RepID=A0ABV2GF28_9BACL